MAKKSYKEKPVKVFCNNCGNAVIGMRDETGLTKVRCPRCGTLTASRIIGRRHIRVDVYAPQGQELVDDDES